MKPAALAAAAVIAGGGAYEVTHSDKAHDSQHRSHYIAPQNRAKVFKLAEDHPDVYSVSEDPDHPGLLKVSMKVQPGHNSPSFLADALAFDQIDSFAAVESYNGNSDIVHPGQELTVDYDPDTGLIVPKPELDSSGQ